MTTHIGGRDVGPKAAADVYGQKPTARQCTSPALYSADSAIIAQRPGPT